MSMQKQTFAAVLVAGAISGFGAAEMIHAQVPGYATKVLMKTDLQNLPGQEAIFYASDWPPGFRLPWHVHQEGHEFVYVIEGEQTFEIEGVGTKIVKAGEIVYTPPNTPGAKRHRQTFKNASYTYQGQGPARDDRGEAQLRTKEAVSVGGPSYHVGS
jgi:quercetin dioxygenase-like cupin family protein